MTTIPFNLDKYSFVLVFGVEGVCSSMYKIIFDGYFENLKKDFNLLFSYNYDFQKEEDAEENNNSLANENCVKGYLEKVISIFPEADALLVIYCFQDGISNQSDDKVTKSKQRYLNEVEKIQSPFDFVFADEFVKKISHLTTKPSLQSEV